MPYQLPSGIGLAPIQGYRAEISDEEFEDAAQRVTAPEPEIYGPPAPTPEYGPPTPWSDEGIAMAENPYQYAPELPASPQMDVYGQEQEPIPSQPNTFDYMGWQPTQEDRDRVTQIGLGVGSLVQNQIEPWRQYAEENPPEPSLIDKAVNFVRSQGQQALDFGGDVAGALGDVRLPLSPGTPMGPPRTTTLGARAEAARETLATDIPYSGQVANIAGDIGAAYLPSTPPGALLGAASEALGGPSAEETGRFGGEALVPREAWEVPLMALPAAGRAEAGLRAGEGALRAAGAGLMEGLVAAPSAGRAAIADLTRPAGQVFSAADLEVLGRGGVVQKPIGDTAMLEFKKVPYDQSIDVGFRGEPGIAGFGEMNDIIQDAQRQLPGVEFTMQPIDERRADFFARAWGAEPIEESVAGAPPVMRMPPPTGVPTAPAGPLYRPAQMLAGGEAGAVRAVPWSGAEPVPQLRRPEPEATEMTAEMRTGQPFTAHLYRGEPVSGGLGNKRTGVFWSSQENAAHPEMAGGMPQTTPIKKIEQDVTLQNPLVVRGTDTRGEVMGANQPDLLRQWADAGDREAKDLLEDFGYAPGFVPELQQQGRWWRRADEHIARRAKAMGYDGVVYNTGGYNTPVFEVHDLRSGTVGPLASAQTPVERLLDEAIAPLRGPDGRIRNLSTQEIKQLYETVTGTKYPGDPFLDLDDLRYAIEQGGLGQDWYARWGRAVQQHAEAHGMDAPVYQAIFGVLSSQETPVMNLTKTNYTMATINRLTQGGSKPLAFAPLNKALGGGSRWPPAMRARPLNAGQVQKVVTLWNQGVAGVGGMKTPTYAATHAAAASGRYIPGVTVDTWHGKFFGFGGSAGGHLSGNVKFGENQTPFLFAQRMTQYLASELGLAPDAAQAGMWAIVKNSVDMRPTPELLQRIGANPRESYESLLATGKVSFRDIADDIGPRIGDDLIEAMGDPRYQASLRELEASQQAFPTTAQPVKDNAYLNFKSEAKTLRSGDIGAEVNPARNAELEAGVAGRSPVVRAPAGLMQSLGWNEAEGSFDELRQIRIPHSIEKLPGADNWGIRLPGGNSDTAEWVASHLFRKAQAAGKPVEGFSITIPGGPTTPGFRLPWPSMSKGLDVAANPNTARYFEGEFDRLDAAAAKLEISVEAGDDAVYFLNYRNLPIAEFTRRVNEIVGTTAIAPKVVDIPSYLRGADDLEQTGARLDSRFDPRRIAARSRQNTQQVPEGLPAGAPTGEAGAYAGTGAPASPRPIGGGSVPEPRPGRRTPEPESDLERQLRQSLAGKKLPEAEKLTAGEMRQALADAGEDSSGTTSVIINRYRRYLLGASGQTGRAAENAALEASNAYKVTLEATGDPEAARLAARKAAAQQTERSRRAGEMGGITGDTLEKGFTGLWHNLQAVPSAVKRVQTGGDVLGWTTRQLLPTVTQSPKAAIKSAVRGTRAYFSGDDGAKVFGEIAAEPRFSTDSVEAGVKIPSMKTVLKLEDDGAGGFQTPGYEKRRKVGDDPDEEKIVDTFVDKLADAMPLQGRSERAMRAGLISAASDLRNGMLDPAIKAYGDKPELLKKYVEHYGHLSKIAVLYGDVPEALMGISNNFYSLRNVFARFQMIMQPVTKPGQVFRGPQDWGQGLFSPSPRGVATKNLVRFAVSETANLKLLAAVGAFTGAFVVEDNPLDPGFGRISFTRKDGTQYTKDLLGGAGTLIKAIAHTGQWAVDTSQGKESKFDPAAEWIKFFRYKLSAVPAAAVDTAIMNSFLKNNRELRNSFEKNWADPKTWKDPASYSKFLPFWASGPVQALLTGTHDVKDPGDMLRTAALLMGNWVGAEVDVYEPSVFSLAQEKYGTEYQKLGAVQQAGIVKELRSRGIQMEDWQRLNPIWQADDQLWREAKAAANDPRLEKYDKLADFKRDAMKKAQAQGKTFTEAQAAVEKAMNELGITDERELEIKKAIIDIDPTIVYDLDRYAYKQNAAGELAFGVSKTLLKYAAEVIARNPELGRVEMTPSDGWGPYRRSAGQEIEEEAFPYGPGGQVGNDIMLDARYGGVRSSGELETAPVQSQQHGLNAMEELNRMGIPREFGEIASAWSEGEFGSGGGGYYNIPDNRIELAQQTNEQGVTGAAHEMLHAFEFNLTPQERNQLYALIEDYPPPAGVPTSHHPPSEVQGEPTGLTAYYDYLIGGWQAVGMIGQRPPAIPTAIQQFIRTYSPIVAERVRRGRALAGAR